jgi:hypothetical protein
VPPRTTASRGVPTGRDGCAAGAASPPPRLNTLTDCTSCCALPCIDSAAAAACDTIAALRCTACSICPIAPFTCSMPAACSCDAVLIWPMWAATFSTEATISPMVRPASSTWLVPAATFCTDR